MKKYKKDCDFSYSIGVFPTLELLYTRPDSVSRILISSRGAKNRGIHQIESLCCQNHIHIEVADSAVDRIAECANAYVVGVFWKYCTPLQPGNHVVLVNPSDSGNLGTLLRAAVAFNLTNIAIIRPAVDAFDPKVIRASMGAIFRTNIAYFGAFEAYSACFDNHLYPFMTDGETPLPRAAFAEPFSLIFGSEGAGLDARYHRVGESIVIPHTCAVDSLNLSLAVAIAGYASAMQQQS